MEINDWQLVRGRVDDRLTFSKNVGFKPQTSDAGGLVACGNGVAINL